MHTSFTLTERTGQQGHGEILRPKLVLISLNEQPRSKQQRQLARKSSSKKHRVMHTPIFSRQSVASGIPNTAIVALYKPHEQSACNPRRGEQAHARLSDTTSGFELNHQTGFKTIV
jgi:hypothetical protein